MIKSVLITGANGGLGKECARQLALQDGIEKIYLGCRNKEKAKVAKKDLEKSTGKSIFDILIFDVSNLDSVRSAIESLKEPIEGLVMNAGGMGGRNFMDKTIDGVTQIFAVNVLGHVLLAEELLKNEKLSKVGLYVGTEAARGIPGMAERPNLKTSSVDEFASIADGSFFGTPSKDPMITYGPVKFMATLWMSSLSRKYPAIRLIAMSPGATTGTDVTSSLPFIKRIMFKLMMELSVLSKKMHRLEVGAKRFVDGLMDESFKSGIFYASKNGMTGPVGDQGDIFSDLKNQTFQNNASEAIHRFIK
jgi:NAD(P)-dependent dehydrogenase (short-subunit alcohol dehydrogenase family)